MMTNRDQVDPADDEQVLAALLAVYLARNDAPCPKCRYNLRGVTNGLCPECGEKIVISIGRVDESSMPWILAMALYGLAVMISGLAVLTVFVDGPHILSVASPLAVLTAFGVAIAGFTLLTIRREKMWVLSMLTQCAIMLSVLFVPLAAIVVYTLVELLE